MGDYLPKKKPGQSVSDVTASVAVTGGNLIEVTGDRTVGPAAANSVKWIGFAGHDAAVGESVTFHRGGIQKPIASGAIGAGVPVYPAAGGKVSATAGTGQRVGVSLSAAADGAAVLVACD